MDEDKIARDIANWLYLRCGEDQAKADRLLAMMMRDYYRQCALIDGFCLEPRK